MNSTGEAENAGVASPEEYRTLSKRMGVYCGGAPSGGGGLPPEN